MSKKGCFNPECKTCTDQKKYTRHFDFCPVCGHKMAYVCGDRHCYAPLPDVLKKYCDECLTKRAEQAKNLKNTIPKAVDQAPKIVAAAATVGTAAAAVGTTAVVIVKKLAPLVIKK